MDRHTIKKLFQQLEKQPRLPFPKTRKSLDAPCTQGVYVIRSPSNKVLHVGRSHRGRYGLWQRLRNHLQGYSSFVYEYLGGDGSKLRKRCYTFQCLEIKHPRERALLEHFATAYHCPAHLGLGELR